MSFRRLVMSPSGAYGSSRGPPSPLLSLSLRDLIETNQFIFSNNSTVCLLHFFVHFPVELQTFLQTARSNHGDVVNGMKGDISIKDSNNTTKRIDQSQVTQTTVNDSSHKTTIHGDSVNGQKGDNTNVTGGMNNRSQDNNSITLTKEGDTTIDNSRGDTNTNLDLDVNNSKNIRQESNSFQDSRSYRGGDKTNVAIDNSRKNTDNTNIKEGDHTAVAIDASNKRTTNTNIREGDNTAVAIDASSRNTSNTSNTNIRGGDTNIREENNTAVAIDASRKNTSNTSNTNIREGDHNTAVAIDASSQTTNKSTNSVNQIQQVASSLLQVGSKARKVGKVAAAGAIAAVLSSGRSVANSQPSVIPDVFPVSLPSIENTHPMLLEVLPNIAKSGFDAPSVLQLVTALKQNKHVKRRAGLMRDLTRSVADDEDVPAGVLSDPPAATDAQRASVTMLQLRAAHKSQKSQKNQKNEDMGTPAVDTVSTTDMGPFGTVKKVKVTTSEYELTEPQPGADLTKGLMTEEMTKASNFEVLLGQAQQAEASANSKKEECDRLAQDAQRAQVDSLSAMISKHGHHHCFHTSHLCGKFYTRFLCT